MKKIKYMKMNDSASHLSLGNFIEMIKKESASKFTAIQSEIFCVLFDLPDISDTTVNNYCTGYRAINSLYKEKYISLKKEYEKDKQIFKSTLFNVLAILDGHVYIDTNYTFSEFLIKFNSHPKIKRICISLYYISKNDSSVQAEFSDKLYCYIENNTLYEFIADVLFFTILEKKQPVYAEDEILESIQNAIYNTNISAIDISEFLNIKLVEGAWAIRGMTLLAKKGNPYACIELGGLEFYGHITGEPRYVHSYHYYKTASEKNHPVATWFVGYMHYNGYVGTKSEEDYQIAWSHFIKAEKLGCTAAINSIGLAYLEGKVPCIKEKDNEKAMTYFYRAADKNYVYAFNNLGSIYEGIKDYIKAFEFYIKAADLGQSWAANKVGDFYRTGKGVPKNEMKAFEYFQISAGASIHEICLWSKFNLGCYFYKDGNINAGIEKNIDMAIKLFEDAAKGNILNASEELIDIYADLYFKDGRQNQEFKHKIEFHILQIQKDANYREKSEMKIREINKQLKL